MVINFDKKNSLEFFSELCSLAQMMGVEPMSNIESAEYSTRLVSNQFRLVKSANDLYQTILEMPTRFREIERVRSPKL